MKNRKTYLTITLVLIGLFAGLSVRCASKEELHFEMDEESVYEDNVIVKEEKASDSLKGTVADGTDAEGSTVDCLKIVVFICGYVNKPGVYELDKGSRVSDALDMAGGFSEEADRVFVNLAGELKDGMKVYVPSMEETAQNSEYTALLLEEADDNEDSGRDSKVNLNTATKEQLMQLPGIGESKAESIISYRNTNGYFSSVEEIMNITGIKEGLFNKIKDRIFV